jgi:hypothetical protein
MKKIVAVIGLLLFTGSLVLAQTAEPDPAELGTDTAQQALQEVSISKFEDPGFWRVYMPIDQGVVSYRRLEGAPADKEPIPEEEELGIEEADRFVLGVKAEFFRRGSTSIYVQPTRPLAVPGIAKTISVWVVGRNFNHLLRVVIADYFGNTNVLNMGTLNFSGWKKLTVAVPPTVQQRNYHYTDRMGIQILGFIVEPALLETFGTYYVYFDSLRVTTDLFAEESRDEDDMVDSW